LRDKKEMEKKEKEEKEEEKKFLVNILGGPIFGRGSGKTWTAVLKASG